MYRYPTFYPVGSKKCSTPVIPQIYILLMSNFIKQQRFVILVTFKKCPIGFISWPSFADVCTLFKVATDSLKIVICWKLYNNLIRDLSFVVKNDISNVLRLLKTNYIDLGSKNLGKCYFLTTDFVRTWGGRLEKSGRG